MDGVVFITIVTALLIWLVALTFWIWRNKNFLKELFPKSGERDIRKKFEELITKVDGFEEELKEFKESLDNLEKQGLTHLQKASLLRYNPYDDTGGDQSFSIVLLDDEGSGILITSLHARNGTRVFAKPVKSGKAGKYQFSKEEEQVVKQAMT